MLLRFVLSCFVSKEKGSEMQKRPDLIRARPQRSFSVPELRREQALSRLPGRPNAPLQGVSTKLKNNDTPREESNANSHHQDPHSSLFCF